MRWLTTLPSCRAIRPRSAFSNSSWARSPTKWSTTIGSFIEHAAEHEALEQAVLGLGRQRPGDLVLLEEGAGYLEWAHVGAVRLSNALPAFSVIDEEGELLLPIREERYGDTLYSFVQGLLRISDVTYLSRERVRSTFMEDFRGFMEERVPAERRTFDWSDAQRDPDGKYVVDCRVNGTARPLFVFAVPNDDKARDATISLLQFERWGLAFRSMAIFEDQEEANRKVLARFSDVCEKQFSNLATNRDRIARFLEDALRG